MLISGPQLIWLPASSTLLTSGRHARQNHVPRVSTNQAAQPQGNTVSLDIYYDNPVAQNDPLLIPSFTNETDVFISQTLKEKVWNFPLLYF
jgi:hypothetical protein